MNGSYCLHASCISLAALAASAQAAPPADFDATRRAAAQGLRRARRQHRDRREWQGRRSRKAGAFATSRRTRPSMPTRSSSTGSTGKAFTNAALATLVDEGKIKWDDKVIDHMPDFRMWDPWVTREMTIRDLLVHRSGLGLGAGRSAVLPQQHSVAQGDGARHPLSSKPATSFRSGYAYDNILYMAAGQLIEEVSGQTWEQLHSRSRLRPLGHEELDRHRRGLPGQSQSCATAQPQRRAQFTGWARSRRSTRTRPSHRMPRRPAGWRSAPTT